MGFFWPNGAAPESATQLAAAESPAAPASDGFNQVQPFLKKYCFECHSGESPEEGLGLDRVADANGIRGDRRRWEKVFKLVKIGTMPPADMDQPAQEERDKFVAWLDHTLFYVDCNASPDPGRVTIRRLNRNEYDNTIRDLLGIDFEPAADFPTDDVGYGFDNIGDVLTVPPLLIEKYLDAAEQVVQRAIITRDPQYRVALTDGNNLRSRERGSTQDGNDGRVFPSNATAYVRHEFPRDGEYIVRVAASADQAGDELARMQLGLDDKTLQEFEIKGQRESHVYEHRLTAKAGEARVEITFINDFYNEKEEADRNLHVQSVEIEGPLGLPADASAGPHRLLANRPVQGRSVDAAARANLTPFLKRAFRRPVNEAEVAQYAKFVQLAVDRGESFERGMQVAVQAVLVSPQFLFRIESDKRPNDPTARHSLNDYELASRLSYFLWSSMPDDELFELADRNMLQDDKVLDAEVSRMLADPRADALVENFAGQWLALRKLGTNEVEPDPEMYPEFSDLLRKDMWEETERFFSDLVHEDRSILDLISGRYTFVNDRLAKHYGLKGVSGDKFRRVELKDQKRAGILTHGSILTLTSYPDRTSPVKRGEWVLANILGDKPPDPPPLVPGLDVTRKANPDLPLRKQLEMHRADPGCASCHKVMDEIGFGLENFDAIGRWRDKDGKFDIDTVGTLPNGETFDGPLDLVEILMARKDEFSRCLSEKLLTYALGRGLEYYDRCTVDDVVAAVRSNDYRFSAMVRAIVKSEPFRMRRGDEKRE